MPHPELSAETRRRRTFAIISHPDAGKTTLTEKLLLYGGAIRQAGSVKARKAARHATSDWMEIEKQRGISVTSSAMQFDFDGYRINILDTPGHQDFSEDTYRTLVAADSAVMLIDCAKGVEEQTVKLFKVCRMRSIPIFTFVNKLDRAGKDPFALMEELENVLGIRSCPVNWPIGLHGDDFKGVYHRDTREVEMYRGGNHGQTQVEVETISIDDPALPGRIGQTYYDKLMEDIELLDVAGDPFDLNMILSGQLTPMFFGSAFNNFGVEPFLKRFLSYTKSPTPRVSDQGPIDPESDKFTGFIFKIQANMNPAHRDRLAFMRVCSGVFEKGMTVWHSSSGERIKLAQPQQFMAQEHETVELAYPGDIIGLFDPGIFRLGDTLCTGAPVRYSGIPLFAPEFFSRVSPVDSMKRKQFLKGITQLSQEGAIQTFKRPNIGREEMIAGVVGVLQMDVLEYRLKSEYGVDITRETLPYRFVRWVAQTPKPIDRLRLTSTTVPAIDRAGRDVLLFENEWSIRLAMENNEGLVLNETADRAAADAMDA
ncbi:MAG: peptide chain release factor 3 [Clostridia bacterium]|nr:peptide chain release factor 3 [Clostridia bacterium]